MTVKIDRVRLNQDTPRQNTMPCERRKINSKREIPQKSLMQS